MKYSAPLHEGIFLKRYKRFFADFIYQKKTLTAHVPNSGSMKGCAIPNIPCRVFHHTEGARKLAYTLEMVKTPAGWVGVNTMRPNQLLWEAWEAKIFSSWSQYDRAQREVKINAHSRIDMVLWNSKKLKEERLRKYDFSKAPPRLHLVEIKNVSMADGGRALFPDAVTERGQKHLRDLMSMIDAGHTAELIFVIQREDCRSFAPADDIDPAYGRLLRQAAKHGVIISPYACRLSPEGIELVAEKIPIVL